MLLPSSFTHVAEHQHHAGDFSARLANRRGAIVNGPFGAVSGDEQRVVCQTDNHAFADKAGTVLINPLERVNYPETIATRELQPGRVYSVDVFFPKYPELRSRQKFMTAPFFDQVPK